MVDIQVLIVEDEAAKIAEIVGCLVENGVARSQIEIAQAGSGARRILTERKFALLIVDLMIPMWPENEPDRNGGVALLSDMMESDQYKLPDTVIGLTQYDDLREDLAEEFRSLHWSLDLYDPADLGWKDRLGARTRYLVRAAGGAASRDYGIDVAIVTALPMELKAVRSLEWAWQPAEALDSGTFVYRGTGKSANQFSAVAACAPRMGMVATALLASKIISTYAPRLLVMTGICAGLRGACEIGDVLLADPCWDYQSGKVKRNVTLISPDQIDVALEVRQRFDLLSEDTAALAKAHEHFRGRKPDRPPTLRIGPVASGSAVLADTATIKEIKDRQHRSLLGVEMEQYGLYCAAKDAGLPRPRAFGLKSVVDFATGAKSDDYQAYGAFISTGVLELFLERYGTEVLSM